MAASARSYQLQLLRLQTRSASSWLRRFIFGEEDPEAKVSVEQSPRNEGVPRQLRSKQQQLDALLTTCEGGEWDPISRTKVLMTCERIYSHAIPNASLQSLKTADSVRAYFTSLRPGQPRKTFPSIHPAQLPQNLSFSERRRKTSSAKRVRVPFSNFSDPKHAQFPVLWKGYTKPGTAGSRKVYQRRKRNSKSLAKSP